MSGQHITNETKQNEMRASARLVVSRSDGESSLEWIVGCVATTKRHWIATNQTESKTKTKQEWEWRSGEAELTSESAHSGALSDLCLELKSQNESCRLRSHLRHFESCELGFDCNTVFHDQKFQNGSLSLGFEFEFEFDFDFDFETL